MEKKNDDHKIVYFHTWNIIMLLCFQLEKEIFELQKQGKCLFKDYLFI